MSAKEVFQNQVLEDIKAIARELSQIQSFSGLLAQQQKIQNLYEKFIFLKQLNTSKYQQILLLDNTEAKEVTKDIPEVGTEAKDFHYVEKQGNNEDKVEEITELREEEVLEKPHDKEEGLKPINIEIAEIKPVEREKKFNPIKLDFNDSIAFISQLFNGSKASMDAEFKFLNETHTMEEAKEWMEKMFIKYNWQNKEEFVERLSGLIVHRFES
ncbi:MAG: hypothetical protein LBQ84_00780 [Flavobacteriaceae bacterium]|jgi:hypothetical protein|nr:hypothetical protein [Flavobacteriaceae bacterium]